MEFEERIEILNGMNTAKLIADIKLSEETLEKLMLDDAGYRNINARYLAAYNDDCTAVKELDSELMYTAQSTQGDIYVTLERMTGKKPTAALMETWLAQQRHDNQGLVQAITRQYSVTFQCETNKIKIDMAKKRLESLKGVLALRVAQISFLAPEA